MAPYCPSQLPRVYFLHLVEVTCSQWQFCGSTGPLKMPFLSSSPAGHSFRWAFVDAMVRNSATPQTF